LVWNVLNPKYLWFNCKVIFYLIKFISVHVYGLKMLDIFICYFSWHDKLLFFIVLGYPYLMYVLCAILYFFLSFVSRFTFIIHYAYILSCASHLSCLIFMLCLHNTLCVLYIYLSLLFLVIIIVNHHLIALCMFPPWLYILMRVIGAIYFCSLFITICIPFACFPPGCIVWLNFLLVFIIRLYG
jgi:hypothetical protein